MRAGLALGALSLAACATQTQLVVVVDTNLDVPAELDLVEVSVLGPDGVSTVTPQPLDGPGAPSFPLTLGVAPSGEALGPITVTAIGRRAGAEVVRQSATVSALVPGETRTLHLVLYRSCVGRECPAATTCDAAGCVGLERAELPPWTGTPPTFDDSDPCLAQTWDADDDGEGSDACGGADCDDAEPRASSTAREDCNGIDDDCDDAVDEGCACTPLDAMEDCATSCGSTGRRTCTAMGWGPCMPPAETCGATDDDCDGRVDEGFDWVASMPIALTAATDPSIDPDLIWADGGYALVWTDDTDRDGVHFARLDAAGTFTTAPVRITDGGRAAAVAWSGSRYGVAYWHRETVSCGLDCTQVVDRIRFVAVDAAGARLAGPEQLESDAADEPRPSIVWDGTAFVVGYRGGELHLDPRLESGARAGPRIDVPTSREEQFDLVLAGSRLALGYAGGNQAYFTQGDRAAFPPSDVVVGSFERSSSAALVGTGDGFLMTVQAGFRFTTGGGVHLVALDASGAPRGAPVVLTMTRADAAGFSDPDPAGMAFGGGQGVVTWVDGAGGATGLRFVRLAADGATIQATTAVAGLGGMARQTTVARADDGSFGVVLVERPMAGDEQLVFARLACP